MYRQRVAFLLFFLFGGLLFAQNSPESALSAHKQRLAKNALYKRQSAAAPPVWNKTDALYSEIHISLDYENKKIKGWVNNRFRSLDDSLTQLVLDLKQNMRVDSVGGAGRRFVHDVDYLFIDLHRPYRRGEELSVTVRYSGTPAGEGFAPFTFDQMPDGSPYVWTLSEPYGAKSWWPCKDSPADKIDSADIYVTVPGDQVVGSNGLLVAALTGGDSVKTFHWQERYPIATYLISIVAGKYAHFQDFYHASANDSMLLDYYVFPENYPLAETVFSEMPVYLDVLSSRFGPYPFYGEKYGMARFGWGGGMEHQTLTSIGGVGEGWRYVYVHELGHQWFGDAVTCAGWSDIWLNEGFASYAEALYAEQAGYNGFPPGLESYRAYILKQRYTLGGTVFVSDTSTVSSIFNQIVYYKGSWILHMLRHIMGDAVFFDVLKSYVSDLRWRYGSVRTEDFITVCEEKSGRNLAAFFRQWLYFPFFPEYEYSWSAEKGKTGVYSMQLDITQLQGEPVYEMPMDILISFANGLDTTVVIQNNLRKERYEFVFSEKPLDVQLDPQQWILRDTRLAGTETFSEKLRFKNIYPNPFSAVVHLILKNWNSDPARLLIFNVNGKKIKSLRHKSKTNHDWFYEWDGRNEQGRKVSSGIYFVRPDSKTTHPRQLRKIIFIH